MCLIILFSPMELAFTRKAKLNLYGKTIPELIQQARHIVTCMTGNADFTTPNPPLLTITNAANALEAAYQQSQDGSHAKKAEMKLEAFVLKHFLALLETYVTNTSNGDEQTILGSGMEVNKIPEHTGVTPAPADVNLSNGINEGEVTVKFGKVAHAASYDIDYYESVPVQNLGQQGQTIAGINLGMNLADIAWQHTNGSTKAKFTITGLTPGNRILVRVAALNTEGIGTWSDPATMIIP